LYSWVNCRISSRNFLLKVSNPAVNFLLKVSNPAVNFLLKVSNPAVKPAVQKTFLL